MKTEAGTYKNPRGGKAVGLYGSVDYSYSFAFNMYGSSAGTSSGNSSCTGAITTDFEWVPDTVPGTTRPNLADEPPEEVILREAIDMAAEVLSVNATASVEVNHGLEGFPLPNGSPGPSIPYAYENKPWEVGGAIIGVSIKESAKGIRYRIIPGEKNITITCDPSAISTDTLGSGYTQVYYMASIIVPVVKVAGTKLANTSTTTDWFLPHYAAGQTLECTVDLSQDWKLSGIDIDRPIPQDTRDFKWELNSVTSNYRDSVFTADLGKFNPLTAVHLNSATLRFFSVKAGEPSLRVNFGLKLAPYAPTGYDLQNLIVDINRSTTGGSQMNLNRRMRCVRPAYDTWEVEELENVTQVYGPNGRPGVRYGTDTANGQSWSNAKCKFVPAGPDFGGQTAFVQLITAKRKCTLSNGEQTKIYTNIHYGNEACDTTAPYSYGNVVDITEGNTGFDTPVQYLYPNKTGVSMDTIVTGSATAEDTFRTYFMYRPTPVDKLPTNWISMATYEWKWNGTVTYNRNTGLVSVSGAGSVINYPSATETNPVWIRNLPINFAFLP